MTLKTLLKCPNSAIVKMMSHRRRLSRRAVTGFRMMAGFLSFGFSSSVPGTLIWRFRGGSIPNRKLSVTRHERLRELPLAGSVSHPGKVSQPGSCLCNRRACSLRPLLLELQKRTESLASLAAREEPRIPSSQRLGVGPPALPLHPAPEESLRTLQ